LAVANDFSYPEDKNDSLAQLVKEVVEIKAKIHRLEASGMISRPELKVEFDYSTRRKMIILA